MKSKLPVFIDLCLDFSFLKSPYELGKIESIFKRFFDIVITRNQEATSLNYELCQTNIIIASALKNQSSLDLIPFPNTKAVLFNSSNILFLFIRIGNQHMLGSQIIRYLKENSQEFIMLSSGRFKNNRSEIIISMEEDELGNYYIIITNNQSLLTIDELFNFSREQIHNFI